MAKINFKLGVLQGKTTTVSNKRSTQVASQLLQAGGATLFSGKVSNSILPPGAKSTESAPIAPKAEGDKMPNSEYPWAQCEEEQTKKYGAESAKKICGSIKAKYGNCGCHEKIGNAIIEEGKKYPALAPNAAKLENADDATTDMPNSVVTPAAAKGEPAVAPNAAKVENSAGYASVVRAMRKPAAATDVYAEAAPFMLSNSAMPEELQKRLDAQIAIDFPDLLSNAGTSEGVKKAWETRHGGLAHYTKWSMYAGGTASPDKHGYDINVGDGDPGKAPGTFGKNRTEYSIIPISGQNGRHLGYHATVFPSKAGGHGWLDKNGGEGNFPTSGHLHRSPAEAWSAADKHYQASKAGKTSNTASYRDVLAQARGSAERVSNAWSDAARAASAESRRNKTHNVGDWVVHPKTGRRGVVSHVYSLAMDPPTTVKGRLVEVDYGHHKANHREFDIKKSSDQKSKWVEKPYENK